MVHDDRVYGTQKDADEGDGDGSTDERGYEPDNEHESECLGGNKMVHSKFHNKMDEVETHPIARNVYK